MRGVAVVLRGPLRAWGEQSLGDNRDTQLYPTASALLGFVGACAGVDRHDDRAMDQWYGAWDCLSVTAPIQDHRLPMRMSDFQTARNSLNTSGETVKDAVISYRGYLQETVDVAVLTLRPHADPALLDEAEAGLQNPVFTPFLGRKSNPLSALPWLPNDEIVVEGDAPALAQIAIDRLWAALPGDEIVVEGDAPALAQKDMLHACSPKKLRATLFAPSGWLHEWAGGQFRYRMGRADRRLGAPLAYGRRMVDVFQVERGLVHD